MSKHAALAAWWLLTGFTMVGAEEPMSRRATGTFEVKTTPIPEDRKDEVASGRFAIAKTFQGDLQGTSRAEMWTAEGAIKSSAGYVAIERVEGTLGGKSGGFALLHEATMRRGGEFDMSIVVVPESGSGELVGLTGRMTISIAGGKHSYQMDYRLPDTTKVADGVPIRFEATGAGEPALIFVHGWALDRRIWDDEVKRLSARHRVVALDLAGHGDSGGGRTEWTLAAFGEDVKAVAESVGAKRVVLVGHSMGGPVVLEAARRMPERVSGLILVDTLLDV